MTNPDREELVKLADTITCHVAALANEPLRMPLTTWNVVSNDILAAAESLRRLASSEGGVSRIVEAARDIVALWNSPKIQGLPRAERNSAIEDSRAALIDAVHELARSSVGSEQGSSNSKVEGSNPSAPAKSHVAQLVEPPAHNRKDAGSSPAVSTDSVLVAELVQATDLNSGDYAGSNPAGDTKYATEAHQAEQLFCKQSVAGSNPARGTTHPTPASDVALREALEELLRCANAIVGAVDGAEETPPSGLDAPHNSGERDPSAMSDYLLGGTELRVRARLAWNNWPDSDESRRIIANHEARDKYSADAWDRVIAAILASGLVTAAHPNESAIRADERERCAQEAFTAVTHVVIPDDGNTTLADHVAAAIRAGGAK